MNDDQEDMFAGILDAMTTIVGVLLALGIDSAVLADPFRHQRDAHQEAGRMNAVLVFDTLLDFVNDPELQQKRREIQAVFRDTPKGNA